MNDDQNKNTPWTLIGMVAAVALTFYIVRDDAQQDLARAALNNANYKAPVQTPKQIRMARYARMSTDDLISKAESESDYDTKNEMIQALGYRAD